MSLVIDPGHQGVGFDPGAVGNGIIEADLVLQISLYQYARFKELGVPVMLTRDKTMALSNTQRTNKVKNSGMKHCMSNHINAGGGDGAEVIYSIHSKPTFAQIVLDGLHSAGQNKRKIFTKRLPNSATHDYYYMHRDTGIVETLIVEYGFLDSKGDDVLQLKQNWKIYAEAVVKAYCQYAGYKYTSNEKPAQPKPEVKPIMVSDSIFKDVPTAHTNHDDIVRAKELGLFKGYADGTFKPEQPLTRSQMASIAVRLYDAVKGVK